MAFQAIPHRRTVYQALDLAGIFVGMALQAQFEGRNSGQLDARNVFVYANFVATQAPRGRRMDGFPFGLVFVAGDALGRVGPGLQRNGVRFCLRGIGARQHQ